MKAKRFSPFYVFLLVLVVLVLIATEIGKAKLKDCLADYENAQYKYVADAVKDSYFTDAAALADAVLPQLSGYESKEEVAAFLAPFLEKDLSVQSVSTGLDNTIEYIVKSGGQKIASFTISPTENKSKYGFSTYALDQITLSEKLLQSATIEVPMQYTVSVNGQPISAKDALGDRIPTASQSFMPEGVEGIVYTTYTVRRLCKAPVFCVTAPSGDVAKLNEKEDGVIHAEIVNDAVLQKEYEDLAIEATKAYAKYMQNDASFASIKGYFDPSSDLYTNIRTAETLWVIDHNSYRFEDVVASEFYAYSDSVFSCRVSLTHILHYNGLKDYKDYMDMTWYFRLVNGEYRIYASFNNK